jgi:four helix bundle protein
LSIAKGSLAETETFLLLALELGFVTEELSAHAFSLIDEISRMLTTLRARLLNAS